MTCIQSKPVVVDVPFSPPQEVQKLKNAVFVEFFFYGYKINSLYSDSVGEIA